MTRTPRKATLLAAAMAAATLVGGGSSASAAGSGPDDRPSKPAEQAGITERGDAFMGWRTSGDTPEHATTSARQSLTASVPGIDVSGHQDSVDWGHWKAEGKKFAYVKATEGDYYQNEDFTQQYNGSYKAGMIRGSYHFANPSGAGAVAQADYFVDHGGGWSGDGKTLPGVLDIEFNPYGANCYGLSDAQMVDWIKAFVNRYKARTGRDAVIYTNGNWWKDCTGNSTAFNSSNPLWIANYNDDPGTMPGGWGFYTFWQYTDSPIDQDVFNGSYDRLKKLATG